MSVGLWNNYSTFWSKNWGLLPQINYVLTSLIRSPDILFQQFLFGYSKTFITSPANNVIQIKITKSLQAELTPNFHCVAQLLENLEIAIDNALQTGVA